MIAVCDMCKLRTRVERVTGVCAPCRRNFQEVEEEYFDGDFLGTVLKAAEEEMSKNRVKT